MYVSGDPNAVMKDLHAAFEDTINEVRTSVVPDLCMEVESDGAYEKYAFPTAAAWPRVWTDQRTAQGVDVNATYQVDNNEYELTLEFKRSLLEDAKAYKGLEQMVREHAKSAVLYPDYLCSSLVANGNASTSLAYDGNPFYGGTHLFAAAGANNINNSLSASGTSITQLQTDLVAAIAALRTFKDNQGRLINPQLAEGKGQFVVHCPSSLEYTFRQVLNAAWIPVTSNAPGDNIFQGIAGLRADGYLTGSAWYLHYVGAPIRPFIYQNRMPLELSVLGPDSEYARNHGRCRILARQRFRLAYGAFYRSIKTS